MKALATLFLGMGVGYMNLNNKLFVIPMGIGLVFLIMDFVKDKQGEKKE